MLLPVIAGAAGAAVVAAGYHTMSPRSQLYGRTFVCEGKRSKRLALTFDDGPNDPHTLRLLEVLARHQVHATFFLIGRFVAERPEIARAVAQAGHVIANHTYSHPNLIFCSRAEVRRQILACERALDDASVPHARLFRPPFGGRRPAALRTVRELGLEPIMWSVAAWDWRRDPADVVAATVFRQVRGGDVILMHDGSYVRMGADRSPSVAAADLILTRYRDQGYQFVTIPEMMSSTA
jgi:peptidoglycan/xylan/chitin deacetylase (PgdA/CDA1 family)